MINSFEPLFNTLDEGGAEAILRKSPKVPQQPGIPADKSLMRVGFLKTVAHSVVASTRDLPQVQRVRRMAETWLFSMAHVGPWDTTRLSLRRAAMFLPTAPDWRAAQEIKSLVLRTPTGERMVFYYQGRDIPLGGFREIFWSLSYQPTSLPPSSVHTIVDCGGNIGAATAWFLREFPGAKIHIFEPGTVNVRCLKLNIASWGAEGRVVLNPRGVWSSSTERRLFHDPHGSGSDSFFPMDGHPSESVRTTRLDEYLERAGIRTVDLLKLDIEGSELEALKGLGSRLADVRVIVGEIHPRVVNPEALFRFLEEGGFRTVRRETYGPNVIFEAVNRRTF